MIGVVLMNSLVIRPNPLDNEYILGYVFRIIKLNYIHDAHQYLSRFTNAKSLRKCLTNILAQEFDIALFSKHLRKDTNFLKDLYCEQQLYKSTSNCPTICSLCYAEQGFINKKWMSPLQVICEKHLVFLTNKCKHCGRVLEWQFMQFHICRTCKEPISSDPIDPLLLSQSLYLDYILNKKRLYSLSDQQLANTLSFFLMLTESHSYINSQNSFYRSHDYSQKNILESYDCALNYFLKNNLFEDFLIRLYENTPYDAQHRNRIYDCFIHIDQYINDKFVRQQLINSIKKCYFLKYKISQSSYNKIESIINSNSNYHNSHIGINNIRREIFDLITLFQFKYITKTDSYTLRFLIENCFIDVLKSKNGTYQYISIYSLYKLMNLLKINSSILNNNDEKNSIKFQDLSIEDKKNFLYSILDGNPCKYEYNVLTGIDDINIVINHNL